MSPNNCTEADIFDIYRGTTHDGPGLRTTVFFSGCPLRCAWCHNPESQSQKPLIWWDRVNCIGCRQCSDACSTGACVSDSQGVSICRETCRLCGSCVKACPSGAMSFTGRKISLERLLAELLKYEGYYRNFSGGVTASGGEPLLQSGFLTELFRALKERKISTAVDTSGAVPFSTFEKLLPYTDLILYDIKLLSPGLHREYTGQDNALVLANLERIASRIALGQLNSRLWIRTPLIPDATATEENISGIAAFIQSTLSTAVDRWELCAFNKACAGKYERLDRKWSFADKPLISAADAERFKALILGSGFDAEKVFFTGIYSQ